MALLRLLESSSSLAASTSAAATATTSAATVAAPLPTFHLVREATVFFEVMRTVINSVNSVYSVLLEMVKGILFNDSKLVGTNLALMHHLRHRWVSACQTILPILQVVLFPHVLLHFHLAVVLLRTDFALILALVYPGLCPSLCLDRWRFSRR